MRRRERRPSSSRTFCLWRTDRARLGVEAPVRSRTSTNCLLRRSPRRPQPSTGRLNAMMPPKADVGIGARRLGVGLGSGRADRHAARVGVLDDHAGALVEARHALPRRVGVGDVVVAELLALQLRAARQRAGRRRRARDRTRRSDAGSRRSAGRCTLITLQVDSDVRECGTAVAPRLASSAVR